MSNIHVKIAIEKTWRSQKFRISKCNKFVTRSSFGQLQLTQVSLNFKNPCCNIKIRGLGAKMCVRFFYYFNFERNYDIHQESIYFVEKIYTLIKNGKSQTQFLRDQTCFSSYKNRKLTVKLRWEEHFCTVYFVRRYFFNTFNLKCIVHWIHQNINTFPYQKTLLHTLSLFF